jgi:hypothetical protein
LDLPEWVDPLPELVQKAGIAPRALLRRAYVSLRFPLSDDCAIPRGWRNTLCSTPIVSRALSLRICGVKIASAIKKERCQVDLILRFLWIVLIDQGSKFIGARNKLMRYRAYKLLSFLELPISQDVLFAHGDDDCLVLS